MNFLAAFIIFGLCVLGMSVGLICARKVLRKGCSDDPGGCACREQGKDPATCEK